MSNKVIFLSSAGFYSIEPSKIISLPIEIIYSIISNEYLVLESEDSLFDFIMKLFNEKEENQTNIDRISFYEQIEFSEMSETKFNESLETYSEREMTEKLWQKLRKCFYRGMKNPPERSSISWMSHSNKKRYIFK